MGKENEWWVYALYSSKSDIIYVGMSENPEQRVEQHNKGTTKSTKAHVPWVLFFKEYVGNRKEVRVLEKYYKSSSGKRKLRKILKDKFPKL